MEKELLHSKMDKILREPGLMANIKKFQYLISHLGDLIKKFI